MRRFLTTRMVTFQWPTKPTAIHIHVWDFLMRALTAEQSAMVACPPSCSRIGPVTAHAVHDYRLNSLFIVKPVKLPSSTVCTTVD